MEGLSDKNSSITSPTSHKTIPSLTVASAESGTNSLIMTSLSGSNKRLLSDYYSRDKHGIFAQHPCSPVVLSNKNSTKLIQTTDFVPTKKRALNAMMSTGVDRHCTVKVPKKLADKATLRMDPKERIREQMVKIIQNRLSSSSEDEPDSAAQPSAAAQTALARMLEQHLYTIAPSFQEYSNMATLSTRLQFLTYNTLASRRRRKTMHQRRTLLMQTLGKELFRQTASLVETVKQLRLERLTRDCPQCCLAADGSCGIGITTTSKPLKAQQVSPDPVRQLFFPDQDLVWMWEMSQQDVRKMDWIAVRQKTQQHVDEFRQWANDSVS